MSLQTVPELPEPWQIYAGDDEALQVTVRDRNCEPINLDGYRVTAAWRRAYCAEPAIPLRVDASNAEHGKLVVFIDRDQSAYPDGDVRSGVFDVQTVSPDGIVRTVLRGPVEWVGDVDRINQTTNNDNAGGDDDNG